MKVLVQLSGPGVRSARTPVHIADADAENNGLTVCGREPKYDALVETYDDALKTLVPILKVKRICANCQHRLDKLEGRYKTRKEIETEARAEGAAAYAKAWHATLAAWQASSQQTVAYGFVKFVATETKHGD